jgi:hypothetical protein
MPHTRCLTSLSYRAQVCSIHGHSSPPSLSRQPYMRSVATQTLSRTTQVTPRFLARLHAHHRPSLSPLPRTPLGCCRDHKIHRSHGHFCQYYRIRHELDRVCPVSECRPFSVSRVALDEHVLTIYRYGMQYHGQMALQVGVLVAFTQLIPEHQVQVFGIFRARVKV